MMQKGMCSHIFLRHKSAVEEAAEPESSRLCKLCMCVCVCVCFVCTKRDPSESK